MMTVPSILCPVDFSEQSRQALLWASALAQRRGAVLRVLSVVEPLLAQAAGMRLGVDLARTEIEPALREFVDATLPEGVRQRSEVRMHVTIGEPSAAILEAARRWSTAVIVMGTHGLGGFQKLLLGSTTEHVLRRTEWPVLAVPAGATSAPTAGNPGNQINRILVATDFRESARSALQWAANLASDIRVPLVLAHVVEPVAIPLSWQVLLADFESDRVAAGQRSLATLAASFRQTHNECVVSVGPPADTIASLAADRRAGLIVMGLGKPGDSELSKPGSIAYRVLRIAHVAVAVVPTSIAQAALGQAS